MLNDLLANNKKWAAEMEEHHPGSISHEGNAAAEAVEIVGMGGVGEGVVGQGQLDIESRGGPARSRAQDEEEGDQRCQEGPEIWGSHGFFSKVPIELE